MYFQSQNNFSLQCGAFAINHLLGQKKYGKKQLDEICEQISDECINPHRSCCGGDYDANILMIALQREGYECDWHDSRNQFELAPSEIGDGEGLKGSSSQHQQYNKTEIKVQANGPQSPLGFLVNTKINGCLSVLAKLFCISSRHWLVIKKIENKYYKLDSSEKKQIEIGSALDAEIWLRKQQEDEAQIIKVFPIQKTN